MKTYMSLLKIYEDTEILKYYEILKILFKNESWYAKTALSCGKPTGGAKKIPTAKRGGREGVWAGRGTNTLPQNDHQLVRLCGSQQYIKKYESIKNILYLKNTNI